MSKDKMTWEQKAEWMQSQRYPFQLTALDHEGYADGTRWMASLGGENRRYGTSMEDATNQLFDAMLFPQLDEIPLKEYPAWVIRLYDNWGTDELVTEYLEVTIAEMSDDVDCSGSTMVNRVTRMGYLADQLSEELVDALNTVALEFVKYTGYASGRPWGE